MWQLLVGSSLAWAVIGFLLGLYWHLICPRWPRYGQPRALPEDLSLGEDAPSLIYTPALMDELALLERQVSRLELRTRTWLIRLFLLGVIGALVVVIFAQRGGC